MYTRFIKDEIWNSASKVKQISISKIALQTMNSSDPGLTAWIQVNKE
jgi:hypothetical protein